MNSIEGKKPFPWRCAVCREQAVYEAVVDCVRQRHHDGCEYTIKIDGLKTPKCAKCGQVMLDSEAMKLMDAEFRRQIDLLMPEQIRDYRIQSSLTQHELAAALGVHDAAVARWENGHFQSRSEDNLLRLFFGIPQVRQILTTHQVGTLSFAALPISGDGR